MISVKEGYFDKFKALVVKNDKMKTSLSFLINNDLFTIPCSYGISV